jgi:hypothetical protein
MLRTSASFAAAVTGSHVRVTRADLWYAGSLVAANLPIVSGDLDLDGDAQIRATVSSLVIADATGKLVPAGPGDAGALAVYGSELHLRTGVRYSSGAEELLSLGWYKILATGIDERYTRDQVGLWVSGGAQHTLTLADRMTAIDDARFLAPGQPVAATCLAEIKRLCRGLVPFARWPAITDPAVPRSITYQESRLDAVAALAAAANVRAYMDSNGALAIRKVTDPTTDPVALIVTTDREIVEQSTGYTRDQVYNAVVARGEQTTDTAPVQAIAYDTDPASPTRWDGPFGRRPVFYSSPLLTTVAQCQAAALSQLQGLLRGRDRLVTIMAIPNPALEPGDVVTARTPRTRFTGVLTAVRMPLAAPGGAAEYTLRVAASGVCTVSPGPAAVRGVDMP